jgi:hypothetical protein
MFKRQSTICYNSILLLDGHRSYFSNLSRCLNHICFMASVIHVEKLDKTTWKSSKSRHNVLSATANSNLPSQLPEGNDGSALTAPSDKQTETPVTHPANNSNLTRLTASKIRSFQGNPIGPGRSTQVAALPGATQRPDLSLSYSHYGLPKKLISNFSLLGINLIYPWQADCLRDKDILRGAKNFIYAASTGAGKSLVADILMLKRVLESGRKAILILPYVALVQEKTKWLRKVVDGLQKTIIDTSPFSHQERNVRVIPFFGGSKTRATLDDADIAVCTIEKVTIL